MTLLTIELESFRNFARLELDLDPAGGILEAPNGQGKTNFVEAIHYLGLFRSFRGAPDTELTTFGASGFAVRGVVDDGDRRRGVGVAVQGLRKRLVVDGRPARPADAVGVALSVILHPGDIRLVQGSPGRRRRYLDVILGLSSRRYMRALAEYRRVLTQRNRVLLDARGAPRLELLEPWTEQLARVGGKILAERRGFLARWGPRFAEVASELAGTPEELLTWRYVSSVVPDGALPEVDRARWGEQAEDGSSEVGFHEHVGATATVGRVVQPVAADLDPDQPVVARATQRVAAVAATLGAGGSDVDGDESGEPGPPDDRAETQCVALRERLDRLAGLERRRGTTLAGPHRDDLTFAAGSSNGTRRDLRTYGSQGEHRTAALALRLLECEVLTHERGHVPTVLLDDVFSELDPGRSARLLAFLAPEQQVFLTTPKPLAVELPRDLPRYTVRAGVLSAA